jgi:hypothetical protein
MFKLFSAVLEKLTGPTDNSKAILAAHFAATRAEADAEIAVRNAECAARNPAPKRIVTTDMYKACFPHTDSTGDSYSFSCDSSASDGGSCDSSGACGE